MAECSRPRCLRWSTSAPAATGLSATLAADALAVGCVSAFALTAAITVATPPSPPPLLLPPAATAAIVAAIDGLGALPADFHR